MERTTPEMDLEDAMARAIRVDDPFTGDLHCELGELSLEQAGAAVDRAAEAQRTWGEVSVEERVALCAAFLSAFETRSEQVASDITGQMGKPLAQAGGEVRAMAGRARTMMALAPEALADEPLPDKAGFDRKIAREPIGVALVIAPWNYPLLTAVSSIVPAVLAGNSVLLKHSSRTPQCADHFADAFAEAGAPEGLVTALHAGHGTIAEVMGRPEVGYVAFTGSVSGGHTIYGQAAKRFIDAGLELGGKDPGYVAEDADVDAAIAGLVDGAYYNAGQSCCGIERVYVHQAHYERFLEGAAAAVGEYRLGDPRAAETNMGPLAQAGTPEFLQGQVQEARQKGARVLCGGEPTDVEGKGRFFQPALVADCDHNMSLMMEESFGPVLGVAPVASDEEAVALMNDSPYGLTASLWTTDLERAQRLAPRIQAGTVFMNRCDFLDPLLPWVGVKDTGKGVTLSRHGFGPVTRLKSYHFKL
jgi:acyl-CoA reductase-like NAD-dependent aldehyde dehydrogenase